MREKTDIIITSNGPGELVSWVYPVANALKKVKSIRIILALLPCRFSTGNEADYAKKMNLFSDVLEPEETKRLLLKKRLPQGKKVSKKGIVIFLGGDPFWAYLLKKRLKYQGILYSENKNYFNKKFDYVFNRQKDGDLMVDAFDKIRKKKKAGKIETITFFPGSRPEHLKHLIPFYKQVARILKRDNYSFVLGISPFIKDAVLDEVKSFTELSLFKIIKGDPAEIFKHTDFLVTIPGTNTAQAAIAGIPYCVITPLNNPELIPLEGIAGLIGSVPVIGIGIKKLIIKLLKKRNNYFAIPNIKARKKIIPEMIGVLSPDEVARFIRECIENKKEMLYSISQARECMGSGGVTEKIKEAVDESI